MPYLVGAGLALATCLLATFVGLDRDRAFYPTVTIVIASYYALFALMGESTAALGRESAVFLLFLFASVLGFKQSMWIVVGALCAPGIFDFLHVRLIVNPGVPGWWPESCLTYDVAAGSYLALLLHRSRRTATNAQGA